jgi:hypothetical protein
MAEATARAEQKRHRTERDVAAHRERLLAQHLRVEQVHVRSGADQRADSRADALCQVHSRQNHLTRSFEPALRPFSGRVLRGAVPAEAQNERHRTGM